MLDEILLHNKINTLQADLLKFHEEISPVKSNQERSLLPEDEENSYLTTCISVAFYFLKILICLIGPTFFPAVIYCIEGSSQLFWQVTAISCMISLLLAMMAATILWLSISKVKVRIKEMLVTLGTILNDIEPFRYLCEILTSDLIKRNIFKIIYPAVILFTNCLIGYITYKKEIWIVFYVSLVLSGFIFGILTTIVCDILRNPELLPFHSPHKIKMALTTPSPKAKKELDFSDKFTPVSRFSMTNIPLYKQETKIGNITEVLPNYSTSIKHESVKSSKKYQLPFNFSSFFRNFRS